MVSAVEDGYPQNMATLPSALASTLQNEDACPDSQSRGASAFLEQDLIRSIASTFDSEELELDRDRGSSIGSARETPMMEATKWEVFQAQHCAFDNLKPELEKSFEKDQDFVHTVDRSLRVLASTHGVGGMAIMIMDKNLSEDVQERLQCVDELCFQRLFAQEAGRLDNREHSKTSFEILLSANRQSCDPWDSNEIASLASRLGFRSLEEPDAVALKKLESQRKGHMIVLSRRGGMMAAGVRAACSSVAKIENAHRDVWIDDALAMSTWLQGKNSYGAVLVCSEVREFYVILSKWPSLSVFRVDVPSTIAPDVGNSCTSQISTNTTSIDFSCAAKASNLTEDDLKMGSVSVSLGVSLEYLSRDDQFPHDVHRAAQLAGADFYDLKREFWIKFKDEGSAADFHGMQGKECPRDKRVGCSIVDALPKEMKSVATVYLSWTWGCKVLDFSSALLSWSQRQKSLDASFDPCQAFVWVCFCCNNQFRHIVEVVQHGSDELETQFHSRLMSSSHMLILMDSFRQPTCIKRIWCVYELFVAVHNKHQSIEVILPKRCEHELNEELRTHAVARLQSVLSSIDARTAEAYLQSDVDRIRAQIEAGVGYDRVNTAAKEFLADGLCNLFKKIMLSG